MDTDLYEPPLPPKFSQNVQSEYASKQSDIESDHSEHHSMSEHPKKPKSILTKGSTRYRQNIILGRLLQESSAPTKKPTKPQHKAAQEPKHQDSTDPVFHREVDLSDLDSQYAEEVKTLPRSSITVLGLDDEKGQQELRPRGPSAMLPLNPILKDAFEKFDQDFLASNLPEGKCIKPWLQQSSTTRWHNLVLKISFKNFIQILQILQKSVSLQSPLGPLWARFPYKFLNMKEFEHQARQNLSTINFTATFTRTASSCNTVMEKCLHSAKATFKRVKNQIQMGADPERAARRGYENACYYFEIMNKRILIQQRALACLSKSVAHILQREFYTMGNTGLLRREAEMTLLQPHLGDSRRQELRNSPFWPTPLFKSQLVKDGEDFLLKKATLKSLRVLDPIKTSPFVVPTTTRKEAPTGNTPMGAIPLKALTNSFSQVGGNPSSH